VHHIGIRRCHFQAEEASVTRPLLLTVGGELHLPIDRPTA
jgi:hypothetical protein